MYERQDGNIKPIVFRVDRFEEGEFHKKIRFMYTGELITIQFKFWGDLLEAIRPVEYREEIKTTKEKMLSNY